MGPYESENFKTLLLLQIAAESCQTFPEFSFQWSTQNWGFLSFEFLLFNEFFENSKFTIVAYGEIKNLNYQNGK